MSSPSTRKQCDFTKLVLHGYEVELKDESTQDFYVTFRGPEGTLYENAVYRVHVELPDQYPFASPSIGFEPFTIFHPNIDERSGSVCLDVINQTWTPLYSLVNVFDTFLPQLLTYPNPSDPLNGEAASMYVKDTKKYEERVKSYVHHTIQLHKSRQKKAEKTVAEQQNNRQEEGQSRVVSPPGPPQQVIDVSSPPGQQDSGMGATPNTAEAGGPNANNLDSASPSKNPQPGEGAAGGKDVMSPRDDPPPDGGTEWNDFELRDDDDLDMEFD